MAKQTTDSFPEEREEIILDVLQRQGKIRVTEVCDILSIAPSTARLLLQSMQDKGLLQRTHGGAIPVDKPEQPKSTRDFSEIENYEAKLKVARLAASTIKKWGLYRHWQWNYNLSSCNMPSRQTRSYHRN